VNSKEDETLSEICLFWDTYWPFWLSAIASYPH